MCGCGSPLIICCRQLLPKPLYQYPAMQTGGARLEPYNKRAKAYKSK
jgi:hypothetical protein